MPSGSTRPKSAYRLMRFHPCDRWNRSPHPGARMTSDSDDIVESGLRLLCELDALFAVGAHIRLNATPEADRDNLHASIKATLAALAATKPRSHHKPG